MKKLLFMAGIMVIIISGCAININLPGSSTEETTSGDVDGVKNEETAQDSQDDQDNQANVEEESAEVTVDCGGCDEGYYCSDDNVCKEMMKFAPLPDMALSLFANKTTFIPVEALPMATTDKANKIAPFKPMVMEAKLLIAPTIISGNETGGVGRPSIYGNKISFHEFASSKSSAYIYDTITKQITKVPYDEKLYDPNIGTGLLVWTDYGRGFNDNSDIYYYNFANNEQGYISPRNDYQDSPKTFNNVIVWSEQVDNIGGRALYMFWIPSGQEIKIFYKENSVIKNYEVWGGSVVWSTDDCTDVSNCFSELYHYNIATKITTKILKTNGEKIHSASIWDKKVTYIAGTSNNQNVFVYDLDTKLTKKITSVASKKFDTAVYEDKVVWADERDGNYEIYSYDLTKNQEKRLTDNNKDDRYPDIYGNIVVYKNGNMNIEILNL